MQDTISSIILNAEKRKTFNENLYKFVKQSFDASAQRSKDRLNYLK